ncbi:MAG: trimethylamine methyltransferase family protein [Alphaproteobacteria bacterium]
MTAMSALTEDSGEGTGRQGGRRGRGGGRAARRAERSSGTIEQLRYITRRIPKVELLSEEGLALIEENAETILQEIGIEFREDEEAIGMFKDAGADIDGERVRFPRGLARKLISTAPSSFTQIARNAERSVEIGGDNTVFAPVYGPPFVYDIRRYAELEDFQNFVKLAYMTPAMHHSGGTVCEPVDVPVNKRHLDMVYAHMRYSDKPFMGSVTHPERAEDTVAMLKILFGADVVDSNCCVVNLINANSPMTFDATMLGALKVYARANQGTVISPFILAGAMAPVTVAGVMAQTLAEAMAGMAFAQLCRPGAPVIFGSFASSISMQTGAPTFGTPEPTLALFGLAALARRLGVPYRGGGSFTASKLPDAQAAYESAQSLLPTVLAGTNFVVHSAGWQEGGLASGYEKFVMDADQLGMMQVLANGYDLSENGQAMDAVREVGPGSHYLGCAHTQANFETAFYRSKVADNSSFEQWQTDGSQDAPTRANKIWKAMLASYEAPPIDPGTDEALKEFIAKKKASMPDSMV